MTTPTATPLRTGTYLIYDNNLDHPAKDGNFRSGRALDAPLHASGSHQLDAVMFADVVNRIAAGGPDLRLLLIVDLRQESHVFLDGRAVSWCADKDWSNVGQAPAWIAQDEQSQIAKLSAAPDQLVYTIQKDAADGGVKVLATSRIHVARAETEAMLLAALPSRLAISYLRIPVTDHCAPEDDAVRVLLGMTATVDAATWVHFHCHGGDGRTTTFLTMYDMVNLARSSTPGATPPDLEYFRARQLELFHYDVKPNPTVKRWQAPLSELRWRRLEEFRQFVFGDYATGEPWPGFSAG
jgi:hypothetical protein